MALDLSALQAEVARNTGLISQLPQGGGTDAATQTAINDMQNTLKANNDALEAFEAGTAPASNPPATPTG